MKVLIPPSRIFSVASSNENIAAGYPASNLLNEHPKDITRGLADTTTAIYTCDIQGSGEWFGLVNTNARSVKVTIYSVPSDEIKKETDLFGADDAIFGADDDYFITPPVFEETYSLGGIDTYAELITGEGQAAYELEVTYPYQVTDHCIILEVDTATVGSIPEAGCVLGGVGKQSSLEVEKSLKESYEDMSSVRELSNGALSITDRDKLRTFSFNSNVVRDREFYDFMHGIFKVIGFHPTLWRITSLENDDWVVYARFSSEPVATHYHDYYSSIQINLIEVL